MVGEIAFGVDQDGGNPLEGGFFEQDDAHTGFPGAGHAGNDHVRGQILRVVIGQFVGDDSLVFKVVRIPKIKFRRIDIHN